MENQQENQQEIKKPTIRRKDLTFAKWDEFYVDPEFNTRGKDEYGNLEALAADIKANGLRSPLRTMTMADGRLFVVDGHRRLAAMSMQNRKDIEDGVSVSFPEIAFLTEGRYNREKALQIVLTSGMDDTKEKLTAAAIARTLYQLQKAHYSVEKLAEISGKSTAWVRDMLMFHDAPEVAKKMVKEGLATTTAVNSAIKELRGDLEKAAEFFEQKYNEFTPTESKVEQLDVQNETNIDVVKKDEATKKVAKPTTKKPKLKLKVGALKKTHASIYQSLFDKVTKKVAAPALETLVQHLATPVAKLDADAMREIEAAMTIIVGKLND